MAARRRRRRHQRPTALCGALDNRDPAKGHVVAGRACPRSGPGFLARRAGRLLVRGPGRSGADPGLYVLFPLEKHGISSRWTDYLPVADSRFKEELVFVLNSINGYLIAFFRGQVLVAMWTASSTGLVPDIGLPYAC